MRQVSFRTDRFPTAPEGGLEFNNGRPGSAAAQWLRAAVEASGVACKAPIHEDYGWGFWLDDPCPIWASVGLADAEPGSEATPERVASVDYDRPIFSPSRWRKKRQCEPLADRVFAAIERAVDNEPGVTRVN
jgi:hypothetical protein